MKMNKIKELKIKELFDQIYENALDDREKAIDLFQDLANTLSSDPTYHNMNGPVIAKYLERLNKSNDQLIKLAEIIQHAEIEKNKNKLKGMTNSEKDEIFKIIDKKNE